MLIFLIARIRLLTIPLERDEGRFDYIGHWLLRGREFYAYMLDSKLPGSYTVYAFFTTLFGLTPTGVPMGLLVAGKAVVAQGRKCEATPYRMVVAGRESCSRHLMVYSLLSDPESSPPLQQEYIREMQECAPE